MSAPAPRCRPTPDELEDAYAEAKARWKANPTPATEEAYTRAKEALQDGWIEGLAR